MSYASLADLQNALGRNIVLAIYDDDQDGIIDAAPVAACLASADAECDSFLSAEYKVTFPINPVPDALKYAAVDFAVAYSVRRRPDLVRAMGEKSWEVFRAAALAKMKMFASGFERLPSTTGTPSNVGSLTVDDSNRIIVSSADGTYNSGDF